MTEFLLLKSSEEFVELLKDFSPLSDEEISVDNSCGRVLSQDVYAREDIPQFDRSSMDGFAVNARDTFGASESEPIPLHVKGEIRMGESANGLTIDTGETYRIWTGGHLPDGANAVVMQEYTRIIDDTTIEVIKPVSPFENIIKKGEDVRSGELILKRGRRLTPYDAGVLAALGITKVRVTRRPRVFVISSGHEVVPKETNELPPGKIRDTNATIILNMLSKFMCEGYYAGIVPDDVEELRLRCLKCLEAGADVIIVSGGSSIGAKDLTLNAFTYLPQAEILVHGVEIKPGKPTILGRMQNIPLVGLPGQITSASIVMMLFIRILLATLSGSMIPEKDFLKTTCAYLMKNVPSQIGKEEYVRVKLHYTNNSPIPIAEPILGKSGTIYTLLKSDAIVKIPKEVEGLERDKLVEVIYL